MYNKQKIIFILSSTEVGGAENQAILLANEIREKNIYEIEFILFAAETVTVPHKLENLNISYHVIKWPFSKYYVLRFLRLLRYILILRKLRPSILMPYTTYPNIFTSFVWKHTGANLCIWNQRDEGIALLPNWFTSKAISNASCYIANSRSAKDYLFTNFKIPEKKISVIHNGIVEPEVLDDRNEWRRKFSFDQNDVLICMVANLSKYKDHETLFRSFKIVRTKYLRKPVKLLLAGRFDDNYEFLLNLSKELNITEDTYFLGEIDDMGSLLNAIDLSVLSSFSEGLPNAIIESMHSGVPVTGSRIIGIVEALGDDYSEFLANPGDFEDLSEKILFFLNNPTITINLALTNKNRSTSLFTLNNLYETTIKCFDFSKT